MTLQAFFLMFGRIDRYKRSACVNIAHQMTDRRDSVITAGWSDRTDLVESFQ